MFEYQHIPTHISVCVQPPWHRTERKKDNVHHLNPHFPSKACNILPSYVKAIIKGTSLMWHWGEFRSPSNLLKRFCVLRHLFIFFKFWGVNNSCRKSVKLCAGLASWFHSRFKVIASSKSPGHHNKEKVSWATVEQDPRSSLSSGDEHTSISKCWSSRTTELVKLFSWKHVAYSPEGFFSSELKSSCPRRSTLR